MFDDGGAGAMLAGNAFGAMPLRFEAPESFVPSLLVARCVVAGRIIVGVVTVRARDGTVTSAVGFGARTTVLGSSKCGSKAFAAVLPLFFFSLLIILSPSTFFGLQKLQKRGSDYNSLD